MLQESLEDMLSEMPGGDQPGGLSKANQDMKETIQDFKRKKVSKETIERQEEILSRMLDSQKSLTQRGYKEERKAETATEIIYEGPSGLPLDYGQRRNLAIEALNQSLKAGYSRDYQTMIRRYFNSLSKIEKINTKRDTTINE